MRADSTGRACNMLDILMRLGILLAVIALIWLVVWMVRAFVERQRQQVLALPASETATEGNRDVVRILSFSTSDCRQCQTLQAPALERLLGVYGALIKVVKIDAVQEPELAKQYRVMTVPSTVVLDGQGQVRAVNYGFAPMQKLVKQIDALVESK